VQSTFAALIENEPRRGVHRGTRERDVATRQDIEITSGHAKALVVNETADETSKPGLSVVEFLTEHTGGRLIARMIGGNNFNQPSLMLLLEAASHDRTDLPLRDFRAEQIRWAVEAGLGPLLRRCTGDDLKASASPLWPLIQAADLTARVIASEKMDAMDEIIHACQPHVPPLTLLKGISICDQHYPERHLRLMRDIDVLVDEATIPTVESLLLGLGYRRSSESPSEFWPSRTGAHHSEPLFHPQKRVWVEIHRRLFSVDSSVAGAGVFGLDNIRAEIRPSEFRGQRVNRLTDELHLVYLASHWLISGPLGLRRINGMVTMLDVIYLLKSRRTLGWERILTWLDGSVASTHLYLLLTYLDSHRLVDIDPGILRELSSRQRSFGRVNLKVLHALIDRYIIGGRDFDLLMSASNFGGTFDVLLLPGRPSRNLLLLFWKSLRSRARLTQRSASQLRTSVKKCSGNSARLPVHDVGTRMVDDHPRRRCDMSVRAVDGELLVLDRTAHRIHQFNRTASFIWNRCDGQLTVAGIVGELTAAFEVEPDAAREAVTALIGQFRQLGLLDEARD
jgi:hypothetical protein